MKFPKPEQGVERYEVRWWPPAGLSSWCLADSHGNLECALKELPCWTNAECPAYIYDRRTGTVIATNEKELSE